MEDESHKLNHVHLIWFNLLQGKGAKGLFSVQQHQWLFQGGSQPGTSSDYSELCENYKHYLEVHWQGLDE